MKLIVFLGNPGVRYEKNRHNAGWLFADYLAKKWDFPDFESEKKFNGSCAVKGLGSAKLLLLKPETFMNLSGEAVYPVMNFFKIPVENLLVVYDDKDILLGEVRFREKGSSGGHNGIADIIRVLGTETIERVKIGVDAPLRSEQGIPTKDFVLSDFSANEMETLRATVFPEAENKISTWLSN